MTVRSIDASQDAVSLSLVEKLYESAFPERERVPLHMLVDACTDPCVSLSAFYDEDFCGFASVFSGVRVTYVAYLAVDASRRSMGYGSRILSAVKQAHAGKQIVLDVEPPLPGAPNLDQRLSRIAFYERNGFGVSDWLLDQGGETYLVLNTDGELLAPELGRLLSAYGIATLRRA